MKKNELKYFVNQMNKLVEEKSDIYDFTNNNGGLFDEGIYDNNRKMRCINTSKPNENRPLILVEGKIRYTLITADLKTAELVSIDIPIKINVVSPTSNSVTNETQTNKHIDLLVMLYSNGLR